MINVCMAGATGWTGKALSFGLRKDSDLKLTTAVSRSSAGKDLGEVLENSNWGVPVYADVASALEGVNVLIDYTSHSAVKQHILQGIEHGVHGIVGTSGLTAADFADIDAAAKANGVGVVAAGNFAITAAMAQAAALLVAKYIPNWEVIDYAKATKPDVPSGTARELAERLSAVQRPNLGYPIEDIAGPKEARGADIDGTRVHSVRLPSFVVSTEVVFGLPEERMTIRFDAGSSPEPYVSGTLLAAKEVVNRVGLIRGLDTLLLG
ncbi:MAG: 4-hydroxy-tetrahydrodipicolinate reductase [Actinomycetes bacterium]